MAQQPHHHSINVAGIIVPTALDRYAHFLNLEFDLSVVPNNGQYVLHHCSVARDSAQKISVRVHTTGNIDMAASPQLSLTNFQDTCDLIEVLAREAVDTIDPTGNIPINRSTELLEFITGLSLADENSRTVIVIVADTINEIILRESLKRLGENGPILRASVPDKIAKIQSYQKRVYLKDAIESLRTLRNNVLHEGQLPSLAQARTSLEAATDILRHS
ncbi:MAG: hypothetical protein O2913_02650 [Chloroflexi bacterium]|nr:hypothetical protein [Chloroflexota bacterium]